MRLAFFTIGVLHEERDHPRIRGFVDRVPNVFGSAEQSDGFIDRSRFDEATGRHSFGEIVPPRFLSSDLIPRIAATFSLWSDLELVMAFSYASHHGEALRLKRDWFRAPDHPGYVAWWIADDHVPSFAQAAERIEQLHSQGASPSAFNFKLPFDESGQPYKVNQERVKAKMDRNAARLSANSSRK